MLSGKLSPGVPLHFSKKFNDFSHWKCDKLPERCLSTKQLRKLNEHVSATYIRNQGQEQDYKQLHKPPLP
jgi:hypothetical protein